MKKNIEKLKLVPAEELKSISTWLLLQTHKILKAGSDGWSPETVVLDTYERTLYILQTILLMKKVASISRVGRMIEKMIKPWEIAINREGSNDEEKNYLRNLTGMNP